MDYSAVLGILAIGQWPSGVYPSPGQSPNGDLSGQQIPAGVFDLASQVQQLEVLLSKSMVAADPRLDLALLMDLRQQAAFAQSTLASCPGRALASRTSNS